MTRDEGLKKAKQERDDFLRREDRRHKTKILARETILQNISMEQQQKKEMTKLRKMDTIENIERERKQKQESQDFWLKKEFVKNAFNQEASGMAATMINQSKLMSQSVEVDTVQHSRPTQFLKTQKPEQILLQVRNKKIEELN